MIGQTSHVVSISTRGQKVSKTIPILTFTRPYWALVQIGRLTLLDKGEMFGVKTRSQSWAHRGPVLFCNGQRHEHYVLERYPESDSWTIQPGIVGLGYLAEVRLLTDDEKVHLYRGYNNLWEEVIYRSKTSELKQKIKLTEHDREVACGRAYSPVQRVIAYDFGYFFRDITWIDEVLPAPRLYGPIGKTEITDVLLQHFPQLHTYN